MEQEIKYKKCNKCGEEKPSTPEFFHRHKRTKDGLNNNCKVCKKLYYKNNKDYFKEYGKNYRENNDEYFKEYGKNYRENNINYGKEYFQNNKKEIYIKRKQLSNNNPLNKIKNNIRILLCNSFNRKNWTKKTKTHSYLKCNWETFKKHIESQFTEGMSWDNQGEWHYDHIYPVSLAQTEEDMFIFNHYTNFQPLWAKDNLEKSNSVPDGFEEWYESMKEKVFVD